MKTVMTAVAVAALAGSAFADRVNYASTELRAPNTLNSSARGFADLTQNFDAFPAGAFDSLAGNTEGWTTSFDPLFSVDPGIDGQAVFYAADGFAVTDNFFSPQDLTPNLGTISADIAADSALNSYGFTPVAPDTGFIVTRVLLDVDGTIDVLDVDNSDPMNPVGVFIDSGLTWAPGEVNNIALTLGADGSFTVSNNGVDSGMTYTDVSFTLTGVLTPGFDSLTFDFFNQNAGPIAFIDNVNFVPTPGAVAMLGLGGLAAARRRR